MQLEDRIFARGEAGEDGVGGAEAVDRYLGGAFAGLRAKLERTREEFRQHEVAFEQQRLVLEKSTRETARRSQELERRQAELTISQNLVEHDRLDLARRESALAESVQGLRAAQEKMVADEQSFKSRDAESEQKRLAITDKEAILRGRLDQLADAQERLELERQTLRERTASLAEAEQAREALQEQLRRRAADLAARQEQLTEQLRIVKEKDAAFAGIKVKLEADMMATRAELEVQKARQDEQRVELDRRRSELTQLEELQRRQLEELQSRSRALAEQEKSLAEQQASNQELLRGQQDQLAQQRTELEGLRRESKTMLLELPDLELRAGAALDRVSHAREQLRDHLGELHGYVRQAQEDLETGRSRVHHEQTLVAQKEQDLRRMQDEHRLALAGFRQQLIDWQGRLGEMQRLIHRGERGLENRQAKVEHHAKEIDAAAHDLARDAAVLENQQRAVSEQRHEMDRQYTDLRDWYRSKLRELAGVEPNAEAGPPPTDRDILSLTGPVDPGDQALGDLLREHQLVDGDSLHALLVESRRQRRSLRQILLTNGAITVYQLALIETGNVDGLMIGPFRVIDRIRQTPHETVYRVFDPRRGQEAVLRQLSEESSADAVLPDEYRQRFRQLILSDAHLSGVHEVLDIAERPAVLQEWLTGLPASDWPPLAAAPGVCYRLLTQAALGLSALHKQGLVHGRLGDQHLLLTPTGILKLCGAGEPSWLTATVEASRTSLDDLRNLGRIVSGWCSPTGVRKGAKTRPLPDRMIAILDKLQGDGYANVRALLDDLDQAGNEIPPNPEAWDRLLRYVRDHAMPEATLMPASRSA